MYQYSTYPKIQIGAMLAFLPMLLLTSGGLAFAQSIYATQTNSTATSSPISSGTLQICFTPVSNISYGANDASTLGAVTSLQNFLVSQGYFSASAVGTGHFGPLTLHAVEEFQAEHGVPATGFVGPLTRAAIDAVDHTGCAVSPAQPITPGLPLYPGSPMIPATSTVSITSISPASGAVGTSVTLSGTGFTSGNTILMNGDLAASNVSASTTTMFVGNASIQTLTFTVPGSMGPNCQPHLACPMYALLVTPRAYEVTVENSNGSSTPVTFTVTGAAILP